MWGTVAKASDRGSPGFHYKPLRAAARREALPVRRNTFFARLVLAPDSSSVSQACQLWLPTAHPVKGAWNHVP